MYAGVPEIVRVSPSVGTFASPKSITTTRPARVIITFSGLKSRWTSPAWWMASKPERNCDAISRASWSASGPLSRSLSARVIAVDELHRDELFLLRHDQVEDPADVGGDDFAGRADFSAQELPRLVRCRALGADRLQGHVHPQLQVEGAKDLAHSAPAQHLADLVALSQDPSRREGMFEGHGLVVGSGRRVRAMQRETQQALRAQTRDSGFGDELSAAVRAALDFRQTGHCLLSDRTGRKSDQTSR